MRLETKTMTKKAMVDETSVGSIASSGSNPDLRCSKQKFPGERLHKGQSKAGDNIMKLDAVETPIEYDGNVVDMIWVDEWHGVDARSQAYMRQMKDQEQRHGVSAAAPVFSFARYVLTHHVARTSQSLLMT